LFQESGSLEVSKSFAKDVYELTSSFPSDEKFGLVSQLRRAAISVMSNIAEEQRKYKKEFDHFLYLARGSLNETVAQLEISFEFGYMNRDQLDLIEKKAESINRMLWKLSKSLENLGGPMTVD
jgi:four helix bundle protein